MFTNIRYEVKDSLAYLVFNRPDFSNGFDVPMCQEILAALDLAKEDQGVKVLVIQAEGEIFSVGGDLVEMERAVREDDVESLVAIAELVQLIAVKMKRLPKPVIVEVDGPVAGAAFNMVLAADFCLATPRTKFIQAFVNVGLAPDAGGLYFLTRSLGLNKALHLVMTGEAVTAEQALGYGFVYKVEEADKLDKERARLVKRLMRGSSNSYQAMKALVWDSYFSDWDTYAKQELTWQERLAYQADFKEGVMAHAERRLPKFKDNKLL